MKCSKDLKDKTDQMNYKLIFLSALFIVCLLTTVKSDDLADVEDFVMSIFQSVEHELRKIVDCLAFADEPQLCEDLKKCDKMLPTYTYEALQKCRGKRPRDGPVYCKNWKYIQESPGGHNLTKACMKEYAGFIRTVEDKRHVIEFQECINKLRERTCIHYEQIS